MADFYVDEKGFVSAKKKKKQPSYAVDLEGNVIKLEQEIDDELAPVKKSEKEERTWFQVPGAFRDGYQFGDVLKTAGSTFSDVGAGILEGAGSLVEGVTDAGMYLLAGGSDLIGAKSFADDVRKIAKENEVQELFKSIRAGYGGDDNSLLGDKGRGVTNALGQIGGLLATGVIGGAAGLGVKALTALTTGTVGVSSFGSGTSEAYNAGATDAEAYTYGVAKGTIDAASELIFGGLGKAVKATGLSHGISSLDDAAAKALSDKITGKIASETAKRVVGNTVEYGVKASAEGLEEVIAGAATIAAKKLTYMSEEDIMKIYEDENLLEQFIVGAVTSGISQSSSLVSSTKADKDFITDRTRNEQAVFDKEVENRIAAEESDGNKLTGKQKAAIEEEVKNDLERGRISTDTIESVLGGDTYKTFAENVKGFDENETYKAYMDAVAEEKAIRDEFKELQGMNPGEATFGQQDRYNELKAQIAEFETKSKSKELRAQLEPEIQRINAIKSQLQAEVAEKVKGDRLSEAYRELQRSTEKFQADPEKYKNEHARKTIQNLIDGGIANNTQEFHEFADMLAKWSEDKGLEFDAIDNKKLSGTRFEVQGATVNAFVTEDGKITFNVDSKKRLNSLAGHEITHVLEGTKFYDTLAKAVKEYATKKGEWDTRLKATTELYKKYNPEADPVKELTADLVGDYIFTDKAFLETLSVNHRNIFQFLWDEIKYMAKTATAGSKEARALEKAKKAFADAYRASGKVQAKAGAGYSLTEYTDHQKQNWSDSKRIVVYESPEQLASYVQDSISGKIQHKKMYFGAISSELASRIEADTGLNVENYNLSLGSDEILKVLKDHGNEKTEAPRGQRAITEDDFSHIVDVVLNPAKIKLSDTTYNGKPAIIFTGEYNGRMNVTAVVSDKRLDLFVQTMYVNVKKENLPTPIGEQAPINTPEANSGTVSSADSIAENSEKSSGETKNLSPEQEEFFKDSVVRDENGNLKVMYHGTSKGGHTVFDPYGAARYGLFGLGTYFTDSKEIAQSYTKKGKGDNPQVYETYLNITNPMDMDAAADPAAWAKVFPDADFPASGTNEDFYRAMEEYLTDMEYIDWEAYDAAMDAIMSMGYDGITHIGGGRVNADGPRHQVYIAFTPEQIKAVDNEKPTDSPDIRYSISEDIVNTDNEGHTLTSAQAEFFKDSKNRNENGHLRVMYHGSRESFDAFDRRKAKSSGTYGSGFYFSNSESHAGTYGETYKVYLNIKNPLQGGDSRITKDQLRKFIQAIAENEDYGLENYGYGATVESVTESVYGKSDFAMLLDLNITSVGNMVEAIELFNEVNGTNYDGIIAPTETVAFYPEQVKRVDNLNPTNDPGMSHSLSREGDASSRRGGGYAVHGENVRVRNPAELDFAPLGDYVPPVQEDVAPVAEVATDTNVGVTSGVDGYAPMTEESARQRYAEIPLPSDTDVPPEREAPYRGDEERSTTIIDEKSLKKISSDVGADLNLDSKQNKELAAIIQQYAQDSRFTEDDLFREIEKFAEYEQETVDADILREIRNYLRKTSIQPPKSLRLDVDADGFGRWMKKNFGRIHFKNNGVPIDSLYQELHDLWPAYFPEDIELVSDMLLRMEEIWDMPLTETFTLPHEAVRKITDKAIRAVTGYIQAEMESYANELNSIVPYTDDDAPPVEDIAPVATPAAYDIAPAREEYEAIRPQRAAEAPADDIAPVTGERMVRVDSNNGRPGEKQRKWVGTSTASEAVGGKILPDDLNQDTIHYQPISNKETLGKANAKLGGMGYEASVAYFNSKFADKTVALDDIALGERLIQEAVKRGDTKTAGELIQNVALLGTELGQKVQALSIIKRLTPEGQLGLLKKTIERGKTKGDKTFEGVELTQDMIDKILAAYGKDGTYDQAKLNKAVEDVKQQIADQMKVTRLEKVNAWRYLAMLGNPKTHIRNVVSNVAMRGTLAVKNTVARTIESVAPIGNRTKTWAPTTAEVKAFAKQTALEMKDVLSDDSKYNEAASIKEKRQIFKNKVLNAVYEINSDLLTKEDWWFSRPAFVNSLGEFLTANGIRTEADIQNNPELVEKAKLYAAEQSQIATFRQVSYLAYKISEMENKNTGWNIAVGSILPFKKTPINIAKAGLNYSPLGFLKTLTYDASKVKNGKMEASELVDHLSQNVTGTALTLVGYLLASMGFLSGGGEDDKEGKYDYQLGEQAYSVNIGGKSYSLSWLSPVAMPLFVGANAYEQLVEGKEWNGDVVVETLAQTLDPLNEMSFLSGLTSVLTSYNGDTQLIRDVLTTMGQNYATQFVPTALSQVATVMDDTKRTTKVDGDSDNKFVDGLVNKLKYKIPGLRQTLEPSTDIWGNEVKQTENMLARAFETFIAPYSKRDNIASDIDAEIKELYSQTGDGGVIPSIPDNYVNFDGEKYEMSGKEYTSFKNTYGQTAYNLLRELMNTGVYKEAGADERADMVNKVYDYARDEAKRILLAARGVTYTNASADGVKYYREDSIKGAIENNMMPDEYSYFRENPEKYNFLKENNISYAEYNSFDDEAKDAWSWAYNNPDSFILSKAAASDVVTYRRYASELNDIRADQNAAGNSISGSRKAKVVKYINSLDADYGEKLILFRSQYDGDDTYNYEIVEYLNSREDLSYEDVETILKKLGFTVSADGDISW